MKILELNTISKLYFGFEDLVRALGISESSARVSASRYVHQGALVRVKKNLYVLRQVWNAATREQKFVLANIGQTPSYISLLTALDYYEISSQMQRDFVESIAVKRTREIPVNGHIFRYSKIAANLYFGFQKKNGFFIATPEKAFLDAIYLMTYGRYALDTSALDMAKLNPEKIRLLSMRFPLRTQNWLHRHGYFTAA